MSKVLTTIATERASLSLRAVRTTSHEAFAPVLGVVSESRGPDGVLVGHCSRNVDRSRRQFRRKVTVKLEVHHGYLNDVLAEGMHDRVGLSGLGKPPQKVQQRRSGQTEFERRQDLLFALQNLALLVGAVRDVDEVLKIKTSVDKLHTLTSGA